MTEKEKIGITTLFCHYCGKRNTENRGEQNAKEHEGRKCVARVERGLREKIVTEGLSNVEKVNDSRNGIAAERGGMDSPGTDKSVPLSS